MIRELKGGVCDVFRKETKSKVGLRQVLPELRVCGEWIEPEGRMALRVSIDGFERTVPLAGADSPRVAAAVAVLLRDIAKDLDALAASSSNGTG